MFTGLIEEVGKIKDIKTSSYGAVLTIACEKVLVGSKIGDSICVNGTCQSIVELGDGYFVTNLSNETLSVSTFSSAKSNQKVNLERALTFSSRIDGHLVNGHVDCKAKFISSNNDGFSYRLTFEIDDEFKKYVIHKGCICINGVSLTIASVDNRRFSVAVIPITYSDTNLSELKSNDYVNIETDLIGKYVEKFLSLGNNTGKIDENLLRKNGFLL